MYIPTRSSSGNHHLLRTVGLSALLLGTTTGVIMAAMPGCQIAMQWETARAQTAVARQVHHSAATLARWKIGAAAWSKAHHGQVYAGRPSAPVIPSWTPLRYTCSEIATEQSGELPLLQTEAMPEFTANASMVTFSPDIGVQDSLFLTNVADLDLNSWISNTYNSPGMGLSQGESFGGPSAPPPFVIPSPRSRRLLAPHHGSQELSLSPEPLPPAPVPTPEPSAMILLSTALVALAAGAKFRLVKLERAARILVLKHAS